MLLYCRLSARLHNRKNAQNGSVFLIMLSILPLVVIGTYLFFTNISSLYLYFKETKKVLFETNKYVMDFRFSFRTRSNINVLFIVSYICTCIYDYYQVICCKQSYESTHTRTISLYHSPIHQKVLMYLNKSILLRLKLNLQMLIFNMTNINLPF